MSDPYRWDEVGRWMREAERGLRAYPSAPGPQRFSPYISVFQPICLASVVDQTSIHLDDRDLFVRSIAEAPKYRFGERLRSRSQSQPKEPSFGSFPQAPCSLDKKPSVIAPRWYESVPPDRERQQRKLAEDVAAFNVWVEKVNYQHQLKWRKSKDAFDAALALRESEYQSAAADWRRGLDEDATRFAALRVAYESRDVGGLTDYFQAVLSAIPLPCWCAHEHVTRFETATETLLIEVIIPWLNALTVSKTRKEKTVAASRTEATALRRWFSYMLPLRLVWEVAQADDVHVVDRVACNVAVVSTDSATGCVRRDTVMSLSASAAQLARIELGCVDPETCFRALKGICAANILELVPIRPIIEFNKSDSRFIEARPVLDGLGSTNLATMDWQDFEHLVRELLEKEFGADVRITQASRDRGVDAVAFDPDPIKGGKFVIQAKRYSNTVDVSPVRDLFGTLMNEGANRGILVTTSNYGRDAWEFAKDKPISLLNGANLLHLLEKHGYHCRIEPPTE